MNNSKIEAEIFRDMPRGVPIRDMQKRVGLEMYQVPNAQWLDTETIRQRFPYKPDSILIGALGSNLVGIKDDRHIMTVAGSRSGKSVHLANNLFHYRGSCLVIDPKGELANLTAQRRKKGLGQDVYILDPFKKCRKDLEECRASYNPLSILTMDNPTFLEDAGLIADALVIGNQYADPHWDESARNFLEGVILHVATKANLFGPRNLVTVFQTINQKSLKEDKEFSEGDGEDENGPEEEVTSLEALKLDMFANVQNLKERASLEGERLNDIADALEAAAVDFFDKPDRERDSVLSTVRRHIKFLGYSSIQSVLVDHDFDLTALKTNPKGMTVYLCLPAGRMGACNRWLRLFVNLVLEAMERVETLPDLPVLLCLDEFPILGYMKQIEDAAGQIAGFGVKLWPILQDLGQLKSLYRDRWETFMGNAGVIQFFGNNDLTTLEYIQKRLGKTALEIKRKRDEPSLSGKEHQPIVPHIEHHDLVTVDEAARYFGRSDNLKRQLVLIEGVGMVIQRVEHYNPESPGYLQFKGLLDGDH